MPAGSVKMIATGAAVLLNHAHFHHVAGLFGRPFQPGLRGQAFVAGRKMTG
jgi:hypothetical protein